MNPKSNLAASLTPTEVPIPELAERVAETEATACAEVAFELGRRGRAEEGAELLAKLADRLGHAPVSPRLLAGLVEGMARWDGERRKTIDLPVQRLSRIVSDLVFHLHGGGRTEELSQLLGKRVDAWADEASEVLCEAGGVFEIGEPGPGVKHVVLRLPGAPMVGIAGRGKPGRNEPCPCGRGRKFKRCCAG
jgi:hypothetical protein